MTKKVGRNKSFEKEAVAGDLWYLCLLGPPSGTYIFTLPYIYPPTQRAG